MPANRRKKVAKPLTPREARTFNQICTIPRDNLSTAKAWISIDAGVVSITEQRSGHESTASVTLKRRDFEKFIDWYNTGKAK